MPKFLPPGRCRKLTRGGCWSALRSANHHRDERKMGVLHCNMPIRDRKRDLWRYCTQLSLPVINHHWLTMCLEPLPAAPTMNVLIFGRAFAGVGGVGIWISCLSLLARISPIEKRAFLLALIGVFYGFSCVVGPLVGGALTDNVSWRWCFYIK